MLHVTPPRKVNLQASWWMRRHCGNWETSNAGKTMNPGEATGVAREYRALGLRIRADVGTPPDHIANELDFMAYLYDMEANALEECDESSAHDWGTISLAFARAHFSYPAQLMARETLRLTEAPIHVFCAHLLDALACESLHGTSTSDGGYDDW